MTHRRPFLALPGIFLLLGLLTNAGATPTSSRLLGLSHRVMSTGATLTLELIFRPKRDFDRILVEAGSGVKGLSPDCHFDGVTANTPYVCRLEVSGTTADAYMTLNVVGTNQPPGKALMQMELQHLTFRNGAFRKAAPTLSSHELVRPSQP